MGALGRIANVVVLGLRLRRVAIHFMKVRASRDGYLIYVLKIYNFTGFISWASAVVLGWILRRSKMLVVQKLCLGSAVGSIF